MGLEPDWIKKIAKYIVCLAIYPVIEPFPSSSFRFLLRTGMEGKYPIIDLMIILLTQLAIVILADIYMSKELHLKIWVW